MSLKALICSITNASSEVPAVLLWVSGDKLCGALVDKRFERIADTTEAHENERTTFDGLLSKTQAIQRDIDEQESLDKIIAECNAIERFNGANTGGDRL